MRLGNTDKLMSEFVSTEEITSIVKEELNSYLSSGAIDDILFPKWIEFAMKNFKKSSLPVDAAALKLENFEAELPFDFDSVKELWLCDSYTSGPFVNPSSRYYVQDCRITPIYDRCHECFEEKECCDYCSGKHPSKEAKYRVLHKETGITYFEYGFRELLRPANPNSRTCCNKSSPNLQSCSSFEFDVRDCKVVTDFREGVLHLVYYKKNIDEEGNILIPNNHYIKEYLMNHLKYKVFETLSNNVYDETFNQILQKMAFYKQEALNARITAENELKKWDKYQIADQIQKRKNRFVNYRRSLNIR